MTMKLLGSPASPYTRKVRIVLAEKRIDCDIERVDVQPVENPVNAHKAGTVTGLAASAGSSVSQGTVLCEIKD